jgi:hypothetical protein
MPIEGPGASWRPSFLDGRIDLEKIHQRGLESYTFVETRFVPAFGNRQDIYFFVIDWSKGHGFFYETAYREGHP